MLVPALAEVEAGAVPLVILDAIAGIAVSAQVMHVVVGLQEAVIRDDPRDFRPHVRPHDSSGDLRMIVRSELIADVVNQRGNHQLIVRLVLQRPGRDTAMQWPRRLTG